MSEDIEGQPFGQILILTHLTRRAGAHRRFVWGAFDVERANLKIFIVACGIAFFPAVITFSLLGQIPGLIVTIAAILGTFWMAKSRTRSGVSRFRSKRDRAGSNIGTVYLDGRPLTFASLGTPSTVVMSCVEPPHKPQADPLELLAEITSSSH